MAQSLQTLLVGIYSAVLEGRKFVIDQHLEAFRPYFDKKVVEDPNTGKLMEVYVPRILAMAMPDGHGDAAKVDASVGFGSYKASVEVSGKMSSQQENTRSTDKTAKYDVTVHAAQQEPTEGMAKLMDLLASRTGKRTSSGKEFTDIKTLPTCKGSIPPAPLSLSPKNNACPVTRAAPSTPIR